MTGATIGSIHDEAASWPKPGDLLLNRCLYSAFIDGPVDAASRLDWLARQTPGALGRGLLAAALRAARLRAPGDGPRRGRPGRAHRQGAAAARGAAEARAAIRSGGPCSRRWTASSKVTVAYGRQPLLAFVWLLFFWALGRRGVRLRRERRARSGRPAPSCCARRNGRCAASSSPSSGILAATGQTRERSRRAGPDPARRAFATSGRRRASRSSTRGCTRSTTFCRCST